MKSQKYDEVPEESRLSPITIEHLPDGRAYLSGGIDYLSAADIEKLRELGWEVSWISTASNTYDWGFLVEKQGKKYVLSEEDEDWEDVLSLVRT